MALAYPISNVKDLIHAFAAKDEFISALSFYLHNQDYYIMDPNDDYYVAPYCFMPTNKQHHRQRVVVDSHHNNHPSAGFLVFSSMAPFIKKDAHDDTQNLLERDGYHPTPHIDTIEKFQKSLHLAEHEIYTFTTDGCVPTADDVSQELEDTAIRVVCDLMRWRYPVDWRVRRSAVECLFGPVLDLAEYDDRRRQQQHPQQNHLQRHYNHQQQQEQPQEHFYDAKQRTREDDDQKTITEEEKKETTTLDDYLPLPPVHTPTQEEKNSSGGGFFQRNDDIFGSNQTFISRYNNNYYNNSNLEEDDDGNTFISASNVVYDENDLFGDVDGI
mmetsp:Transcript_27991/g.44008  ORF Transcript_27991/g.44008 Transcript_27991/m.44008 type:complete len:328 (-) Transcript_27991:149-1132(-)